MDAEKSADAICLTLLIGGLAMFVAFLAIAYFTGMDLGGIFMRHFSD